MTESTTRDSAGDSDAAPGGEQVERIVERLTGGLTADTVFGKPQRVGDRVIITAAAVQRAGGFGFGGGSGTDPQGSVGRGGGAGGGAQGEGRPVAVIEVGPDGVRVRPVLDFTRIGLTVIAALLTAMRLGRVRRRRRH
jgi:uncharacterized spore protein YtfJ